MSRVPGPALETLERKDGTLTSAIIPDVCFQNPRDIERGFSVHRVCVCTPNRARSPDSPSSSESSSSSESWSSVGDCAVSRGSYCFGGTLISSKENISMSLSGAKEGDVGEGGAIAFWVLVREL